MNSKQKLLFLISFSAFVFAGCSGDDFSRRLTAETPAEITSVVLDRDRKTTRRRSGSNNRRRTKTTTTYETDITYRYTVNGQVYNGETEKDGDLTGRFRTGTTAKVCYNPAQPDEADVFETGHRCGT
ncbi:MAG: DUF3592 domain-containing protein [Acidobacteriota bacterium]|nr:DUF3592 domain-containing protein [Acidobacteriota bacterium]